ncbi:MAG: carboxypeptidase regulatory-like domain-containing protein [Pirellulales bacterium]
MISDFDEFSMASGSKPWRWFAGLGLAGLLAASLGCSEDKFGHVSGQVTFEGKPVEGADLEFQPEATGAAPSYARADADGHYKLKYSSTQDGAEVGTHLVKITTARRVDDGARKIKEKLPAKYNRDSDLVREVKPGDNVIDFELTKK